MQNDRRKVVIAEQRYLADDTTETEKKEKLDNVMTELEIFRVRTLSLS